MRQEYEYDYCEFFNCSIEASTGKALLIRREDGVQEWFPRSQVDGGYDMDCGQNHKLIEIKEWICKENGWA